MSAAPEKLGRELASIARRVAGNGPCLIRISMGSDLERTRKYGTSRGGYSPKRTVLKKEEKTVFEGEHADLLIATLAHDMEADAKKADGALASKLAIYEEPFASFYDGNGAREILKEKFYGSDDCASHWAEAQGASWKDLFLGTASLQKGENGEWEAGPFEPSGKPRWEKPSRLYFALTNLCNRSCEFCSCSSDPGRKTFISEDLFRKRVAEEPGRVEVQLEGGEPTLHPNFDSMVKWLQERDSVSKVVVCTNSVKIPWAKGKEGVTRWLSAFSKKDFLLKPSVNSHLTGQDPKLLKKLALLAEAFKEVDWKGDARMRVNLRRIPKPLTPDGEEWLVEALKACGLYASCSDFPYQAYGKAADVKELEKPFVVADPVSFKLFAPDGNDFGTDLEARAAYMASMY